MTSHRSKHAFLALTVLAVGILIAVLLTVFSPKAHRHPAPQAPVLKVQAIEIQPKDYRFTLSSFGTVQPSTQSLLISQVSGEVIEESAAFGNGGFFNRGDTLLKIDDRDYAAAAKAAEANWLDAKLALEEEKARAKQALIDWKRLGNSSEAPELVLRKPQLASAEAKVMSALANFEKAQLDLQRTHIRAPYDGRVKETYVGLGQYVNASSQLADIFATDAVEIRLPLKHSQLNWVNLPENFRTAGNTSNSNSSSTQPTRATITSDLGKREQWPATIVRTEAAIDADSQQLYVVAEISDPFAPHNQMASSTEKPLAASNKMPLTTPKQPLKIGQYVTADIEGKQLDNAIVIPTSSIYQGSFVYTLVAGPEYSTLKRKNISVLFQNNEEAVVESGLKAGDWLVTSPLGKITSGTRAENIQQNNIPSPNTQQKSPTATTTDQQGAP